ncbi:MAG: hypothetical protein CK425_01460 [Parachlamydia sp.]|nr:MAG: hypothetical protein CK425_01460 [Parachlamydia sp.]
MEVIKTGKNEISFKPFEKDVNRKSIRTVGRFEALIKNFFSLLFRQGNVAIQYKDDNGRNYWITRASAIEWILNYRSDSNTETLKKKEEIIRQINFIGQEHLKKTSQNGPFPHQDKRDGPQPTIPSKGSSKPITPSEKISTDPAKIKELSISYAIADSDGSDYRADHPFFKSIQELMKEWRLANAVQIPFKELNPQAPTLVFSQESEIFHKIQDSKNTIPVLIKDELATHIKFEKEVENITERPMLKKNLITHTFKEEIYKKQFVFNNLKDLIDKLDDKAKVLAPAPTVQPTKPVHKVHTPPPGNQDVPFYYFIGDGLYGKSTNNDHNEPIFRVINQLSPAKKGIQISSQAEAVALAGKKTPFIAFVFGGTRWDELIGSGPSSPDGNFLTKLPSDVNLLLVVLHPQAFGGRSEIERGAMLQRQGLKKSQIVFAEYDDHVLTNVCKINENGLFLNIQSAMKTFEDKN